MGCRTLVLQRSLSASVASSMGMGSLAGSSLLSCSPSSSSHRSRGRRRARSRSNAADSAPTLPTTTLVLKNLPFSLTADELTAHLAVRCTTRVVSVHPTCHFIRTFGIWLPALTLTFPLTFSGNRRGRRSTSQHYSLCTKRKMAAFLGWLLYSSALSPTRRRRLPLSQSQKLRADR